MSTRATGRRRSSVTIQPCSPCRCTARRIFPPARKPATWTSSSPTAAPTRRISQHSMPPWARVGRPRRRPARSRFLPGRCRSVRGRPARALALNLSAPALAERDRRVFSACRARGIPVAVTMAGGYGHSNRRDRRHALQHLARGLERVARDERSAGYRSGSHAKCAGACNARPDITENDMTVWGIPHRLHPVRAGAPAVRRRLLSSPSPDARGRRSP